MLALLLAASLAVSTTAKDFEGVVGVAALDLTSGRTFAIRGDERFPMGSVYKLPIAMAVLREVDRGRMKLDARYTIPVADFSEGISPLRDRAHGKPIDVTLRELVITMIRDSDNTACDFLLKIVKPAQVTAYLRELGIKDINVNRSERDIAHEIHGTPDGVARYATDPRDTSTPNAMVELLRRIVRGEDGLTRGSRELVMRALTETTRGDKRIKALLPRGTIVAHKIGTMPGTLNDAGIVTSADGKHQIAIAIFTKASNSSTEVRERLVAKIAADVWRGLTAE